MGRSKKAICDADLRARILRQDLAPGANLDEATLADEYAISRTPLREVLHRLAADGYVRITENRGAKVESMDLPVLRVFFQTAPLIYSSIARQAAENHRGSQLLDLKEIQTEFAQAARDGNATQASLLNHRFHAVIGQMAQNPYLEAALKRMLVDHTRLSQTFFAPQSEDDALRIKKAIAQHDAMISAIGAREPTLAIDLTLQHWELSRDQLERYVRPDPLPLDVISMQGRRHAL